MSEHPPIRDAEPVPWPDAVSFIRQLSHDLRNHLNAAELQVALMNEIAEDAEQKQELKRLREMLGTMTSALQKLSSAVVPPRPTPITYDAGELLADLQKKFEAAFPEQARKVRWSTQMKQPAPLYVDPQLFQQALFELLENASRIGGSDLIEVTAAIDGDKFVTSVAENKSAPADFDPAKWGREPLRRLTHGRYTLGLNRVRMIAEASDGEFCAAAGDGGKRFVSTIILPVLPPKT